MGRVVSERMVTRFTPGSKPSRRRDALAGEEPLEIRVNGEPVAVTMRTPGSDYELAAGFLVSEGVISETPQFGGAQYCRGPEASGENTYNVLNVLLGEGTEAQLADLTRNFYTTSSCGICGKASIEAVETSSAFDLSKDETRVGLDQVLEMPALLRQSQEIFEKTGGLHAAALFDADGGDLLVSREDVGRHNAVDKVIGWALMEGRLPLSGCVLQVSGRASFELIQKAKMAGVPIFSAVSAPSSLAVELAVASDITLLGFVRGESMVGYSRPDRVTTETPDADSQSEGREMAGEGMPVR